MAKNDGQKGSGTDPVLPPADQRTVVTKEDPRAAAARDELQHDGGDPPTKEPGVEGPPKTATGDIPAHIAQREAAAHGRGPMAAPPGAGRSVTGVAAGQLAPGTVPGEDMRGMPNQRPTDAAGGFDGSGQGAMAPARSMPAVVPEANGLMNPVTVSLLLEACERYGVNPMQAAKPQELLAWRFHPGADGTPDAVVFVTAGGMKIKHYEDPEFPEDLDTVDRLRRIHQLYRQDPKTRELITLPMPTDRALPRSAVTGEQPVVTEHRYEGGYLAAGGKTEAQKREDRRQDRARKMGLIA